MGEIENPANSEAPEVETDVIVVEGRPKLAEPPKYAVFIHNDDYTTMEFVIEILVRFFKKTHDDATRIMLSVHQTGKGLAGVYSLEIAETKVDQVHQLAKARGFPLKCSIESR